MFRLVTLFKIRPPLFPMLSIVPSAGLTSFRQIPLPIALFLSSHFLGISSPIASFLGGHSLRMVGPVPDSGSPSPRQSSLFFRQDLCHFIVVQVNVVVIVLVALSVCRGASVAGAVAALLNTFYVGHLERAVVLVVA